MVDGHEIAETLDDIIQEDHGVRGGGAKGPGEGSKGPGGQGSKGFLSHDYSPLKIAVSKPVAKIRSYDKQRFIFFIITKVICVYLFFP
jgi:hypothetical protein